MLLINLFIMSFFQVIIFVDCALFINKNNNRNCSDLPMTFICLTENELNEKLNRSLLDIMSDPIFADQKIIFSNVLNKNIRLLATFFENTTFLVHDSSWNTAFQAVNSNLIHLGIDGAVWFEMLKILSKKFITLNFYIICAILEDDIQVHNNWHSINKSQNKYKIRKYFLTMSRINETLLDFMENCTSKIDYNERVIFIIMLKKFNFNDLFNTIFSTARVSHLENHNSILWVTVDLVFSHFYCKRCPKDTLSLRSELEENYENIINGSDTNESSQIGKAIKESFKNKLTLNIYIKVGENENSMFTFCANHKFSAKEIQRYCKIMKGVNHISTAIHFDELVVFNLNTFLPNDGILNKHSLCIFTLPCLIFNNMSDLYSYKDIKNIYVTLLNEAFKSQTNQRMDVELKCCYGFSVRLLIRLMIDMDFDVVLYSIKDYKYGSLVNGSWNGLMKEIIIRRAQLVFETLTVTYDRNKHIDFTIPFHAGKFGVLIQDKIKSYTDDAVFRPFSTHIWILIALWCYVAGFALSSFEWLSPFGLNPKGRHRKRNYNLGSGVTAVYTLFFRKTQPFKSPKSYPAKFFQNVWTCFCIVIFSMYINNIIATVIETNVKKTFSDLMQEPDFILASTSGTSHISIFLEKHPYLRNKIFYVKTETEGKVALRNKQVTAFLSEELVLRNTDYCPNRLEILNYLGVAPFAIGVPKDAWYRNELSKYLLIYDFNGYISHLLKNMMLASRECPQKYTQMKYKNFTSLFHVLLCAFPICFIILMVEHVFFYKFTSDLKGFKKSHWIFSDHVMYFSQKLYRLIRNPKAEYSYKEQINQILESMDMNIWFEDARRLKEIHRPIPFYLIVEVIIAKNRIMKRIEMMKKIKEIKSKPVNNLTKSLSEINNRNKKRHSNLCLKRKCHSSKFSAFPLTEFYSNDAFEIDSIPFQNLDKNIKF